MRLTAKEKIAYGLGAVGKDMVYMLSASYVLYYFQDILGVSAIAMGIILMAARVFDAFNDPIMGVVVGILLHVSVSILFDHDHNNFSFVKLLLIIIAFIAAYFTPGCPEIYPIF